MNNHSRNNFLRATALLLVSIAFSGLFVLYSSWTFQGRFWQNWYPVLIPESHMNDKIESELHSLSDGQLISRSGTVIEYSDYKDLESLSLDDFSEGKGPYREDPRIDPYMSNIASYFNQGIYEILYLPSDRSPLEYQRLFSASSLLEDAEWILPDWNNSFLHLVLFAFLLLLLCPGSFRFCVTAAALLAAGFIVYAEGHNSVLLFWAVTALFLRLSAARPGKFALHFLISFLPLSAAYFMGFLQIRHIELAGFVFLTFAGAGLWPGSAVLLKKKRERTVKGLRGKDHSLFEPVSLFEKQKTAVKERPSVFLLSAALLCLVLSTMNLPGEHSLPTGIPSAVSAEGIWDYTGLVHTESSSLLPDASDYMKHMAYQESFIYGGTYGLPVPGSVVSFEDYHLSDGRVFESNLSVLLFSDSWYESRLAQMAQSGPGRLLASETSPPLVSPRFTVSVGISLQMLLVSAVFICLFVLIHLSGLHHASEYSGIRSSGKFVLRRKQQAA